MHRNSIPRGSTFFQIDRASNFFVSIGIQQNYFALLVNSDGQARSECLLSRILANFLERLPHLLIREFGWIIKFSAHDYPPVLDLSASYQVGRLFEMRFRTRPTKFDSL